MQIHSSPQPVAERFASILADLGRAVAAKQTGSEFFLAVAGVIWSRIMGVSRDVVALIRAIEAGVVREFRARGARTGGAKRVVSSASRERLARFAAIWRGMPKKPGWLIGKGGWELAAYGSQLAYLLQDPEMKRLLAASPRLGMAMRPVCRMLGIDPSLYEFAAVSAAVAAAAVCESAEAAPVVVAKDEVPREGGAGATPAVEDPPKIVHWWQQPWANGKW